ncbi:MAG: PilT/PilU family type 4a pilus ATPase [Myxococcota bacterium]
MRQLFGKVAVEEGYLTPGQLQQLLGLFGRQQRGSGDTGRMGDLAVALGFMTEKQVSDVIAKQHSAPTEQSAPPASNPEPLRPQAHPPRRAGSGVVVDLVRSAIGARASDLHVHAGEPPFVRRAGRLISGSAESIPPKALEPALLKMLDVASRERLERSGQVDVCVPFEEGYRLRLNVFKESAGLCASIRIIPPTLSTLERLNLPSAAAVLTTYHQGLVLVAGPAGCGKTTTLAALVELINEQRPQHIICLEDPIEYVYEGKVATVTQREIGTHSRSYGAALRAALREDPDIIVISELRDPESISLALTAAETGHLVMGTLHTSSAVGTISRLIEAFAGDEEAQVRAMLAESLRGILCQRLVPSASGGLVPMVELLVNNRAIAHCIRDQKLHQISSLLQAGNSRHTVTRAESLKSLLEAGLITPNTHDAMSVSEE